jgi:hypothetical protein
MTTVVRLEFEELSTQSTSSGLSSIVDPYIVGTVTNGTTANGVNNAATIAVGDPTKVVNTQSTFSPIPISTNAGDINLQG